MQTDPSSRKATSTLARLMNGVRRRPDLPGLSRAALQVQRLARQDNSRVQTLVDAIMADPGLSARLLRMANSARFTGADAGRNAKLERAVHLLGFDAVRQLASGVHLLDRQPANAAGVLAREAFLRSLLAAQLARELCRDWRDAEAVRTTASFQSLGRMLLAIHLPDEALAIRSAAVGDRWPMTGREQRAARRQLGLPLAEIGLHVARHWRWPEALRSTLAVGEDWPRHAPTDACGRHRLLGRLANELADVLLYVRPAHWPRACGVLQSRALRASGHDAESLLKALLRLQPRVDTWAELVELPQDGRADWHQAEVELDPVASEPEPPDQPQVEPARGEAGAAERACDESGLLELQRDLRVRRAVLWRVSDDGAALALEQVLGEPLSDEVQRHWQIDPTHGTDLFSRLARHGQDSVIHDARAPALSRHLPPVYRRGVNAGSFALLRLHESGRTHGLLYLDRDDENPFDAASDGPRLTQAARRQATILAAPARAA